MTYDLKRWNGNYNAASVVTKFYICYVYYLKLDKFPSAMIEVVIKDKKTHS